jgi:YVTN family beta-propeller protein
MRFAVLGPLEVSHNGGPVSLGGRKQRMLLAMLLLHANEVVSRTELVEALWGERPPRSAAESLDTYVYRLRRLLGHERLLRAPGGYRLCVEAGELDADEFERLVATANAAAEAGIHTAAAAVLGEALALWRGSAWAEMLDEPLADGEARRLEEVRLGALESRIEAELAIGRGAELVPELEQLVSDHPLRERLIGDLMLALYRAGRQADALEAFRAARERLVEELGLEPGPELYELQRRILQHDPTLGERRRVVVPASRARRMLLGVAALALAGVITAAFVFSSAAPHARGASLAGANGLLGMSGGSGAIVTATRLTGAPGAVATAAGSVWVADPGSGTVTRIDPGSGLVVERLDIGGDPGSIVSGGGAIWVASTVGATVVRIDPTSEMVTQTITLGGLNPDAIAFGSGQLWVADSSARAVFEIDPTTGSVTRTVALDLRPSAVALAGGGLWVAGYDTGTVEKLDPRSGRTVAVVRVGDGPVALGFHAGALWVANSLDATVSRIDLHTLAVRGTVPVGSGPSALAIDMGSVWVANQYSGTLSKIDPGRDRVVRTVNVGGQPTSLTAGMGRLWAGVGASGNSHRGGTLVLLTTQSFGAVDPALFNTTEPPQFDGLAYDTLVTFQHSGGSDGLRLVPDLALAIPPPTGGGSTYEFRVRPGIRYSNGQTLRAGDFRRGIERCSASAPPASATSWGSSAPRIALRGPRGATSRAGSSPTTRPAQWCSTSPRPIPSSCSSSPSRTTRRRSLGEYRTTKPGPGSRRAPAPTGSSASTKPRLASSATDSFASGRTLPSPTVTPTRSYGASGTLNGPQ